MKIVILPGLDGTGMLLSQVSGLLGPDHDPIIVQYPADFYRYKDIQIWLENILPQDDYIIVAESFSGPLAVMIGAKNPVGLKGIIFVATFARTPKHLPVILTYMMEFLPIKSAPLIWLAQPLLMGKWATKAFRRSFQKAIGPIPTATIFGRLQSVLHVNVVDQIKLVNAPMTYLVATHDRLVPPGMSADFKDASATISQVEGAHFLLQANAPGSAKHILNFITRLG